MWPGRILAAVMVVAGCRPDVRSVTGCRPDQHLLLGACVSRRIASRACGPGAMATFDGCKPREACEAGRARDLETGECLPRQVVRTIAASQGIPVDDDQIVVCPHDGELAMARLDGGHAPRLGCLPPLAPTPPSTCPPGTIADGSRCVSIVDATGIDVVRWADAALGRDGGPGAPPLCASLGRTPGALLEGAHPVELDVTLAFPDNDVSQLSVTVKSSAAASELEPVVAPMAEALRTLGNQAKAAVIHRRVRCVRTSERPVAQIP